MPDFSPQALAYARGGAPAAEVFTANADAIAEATSDVPVEHVLVAIVSPQFEFTGTHVVPRAELVERVPVLEAGGWGMIFSHGTAAEQVRSRAAEMASIAEQRAATIERIAARRGADG